MATAVHEPGQSRFVIATEGAEAVLSYRMVSPTVFDFYRTWTQAELRGRGAAVGR